MSLQKLHFQNELVSLRVHPAGYAVLAYHPGQHSPQIYQAALQHTGQLLLRHQLAHLLEDQQHMAPLTPEQRNVITTYWQHYTSGRAQPLCVATVLANDVFARLATAALRQELAAANISYRLFDDVATASAWLRGQVGCPPRR